MPTIRLIESILAALVSLASLVGSVWAIYRWGWPAWADWKRRRRDIHDALITLPQVIQGHNRWLALEQVILGIAAEVRPNGGGSFRDLGTRLERRVNEIAAAMELLNETVRANLDAAASRGLFECSPDGRNTWVNTTYCRWLQCREDELLGFNFLTRVSDEDREDVATEWHAARQQGRKYHKRHSMMATDGRRIFVEVTASPVPADGAPIAKWVGVIRRLDSYDEQ